MLPMSDPIRAAGVVLVGLESQAAQELEHAVGHGPLLARAGWGWRRGRRTGRPRPPLRSCSRALAARDGRVLGRDLEAVQRPELAPQVAHERAVPQPRAGDALDQVVALVEVAGVMDVRAQPPEQRRELRPLDLRVDVGQVGCDALPQDGRVQVADACRWGSSRTIRSTSGRPAAPPRRRAAAARPGAPGRRRSMPRAGRPPRGGRAAARARARTGSGCAGCR